MPTPEQIRAVQAEIAGLEHSSFHDGRPVANDTNQKWNDLTQDQKLTAMMGLDWEGFDRDQQLTMMDRAVEGEDPGALGWREELESMFHDMAHPPDFEKPPCDGIAAGERSGFDQEMIVPSAPWSESGRRDELDEIFHDLTTVPEPGGIYQVWHKNEGPTETVEDFPRELPYEFPRDYTHVANVRADDIERPFRATQHELYDDIDSYRIEGGWPSLPGVEALVDGPRSTGLGDVIVDQAGDAYLLKPRFEREKIPHPIEKGVDYGKHDIGFGLAAREAAKAGDKPMEPDWGMDR